MLKNLYVLIVFNTFEHMKLARKDCEDYARTFIENAKCGKLKSMFHDDVNIWVLTFELKFKE